MINNFRFPAFCERFLDPRRPVHPVEIKIIIILQINGIDEINAFFKRLNVRQIVEIVQQEQLSDCHDDNPRVNTLSDNGAAFAWFLEADV